MATLKIQIPSPCDYDAERASRKNQNTMVLKAYDNYVEKEMKEDPIFDGK